MTSGSANRSAGACWPSGVVDGRVLGPGLAALDPGLPDDLSKRSPLATAWRTLDRELDRFIDQGLAAA